MSNYIYTNDGTLHNVNSLEHKKQSKYLYKKKVNGKWRYYYDVGEPTLKEHYDGNKLVKHKRVKGYSKLQDMLGYDERDRAYRKSNVADRAHSKLTGEMTKAQHDKRYKRWQHTANEAKKAHKAYTKTPLGRIEKVRNTMHTGKKAVGRFFIKMGKKLDGDNNSRYRYGMRTNK